MSQRVMSVLADFSPEQEVYSIDECFLGLDGFGDLTERGQQIREKVRRWTGLPVCVGIGPSKTLAKLANHVAKKQPKWRGVCNLLDVPSIDAVIGKIEVGEVWGVGRKIGEKLARRGITLVSQLREADASTIRREFSVVLERTVQELRGVSCLALEDVTPNKQQIMSSRSFGQPVRELAELEQAVASYVNHACVKLRRQGSASGVVHVFLQTNRFKPEEPQYHPSVSVPLAVASGDTMTLTRAALAGLHRIYRSGFYYKKAGVMLAELEAADRVAVDWFEVGNREKSAALMRVLDATNTKFGRGTLRLGVEGFNQRWAMNRDRKSPSYTTRWADLIRVRLG
jgi:DNA polymerase V